MELRKVVEKEFLFQTITNGAFSVDTFFFLSGFLVSYIYFRTNAKGNLEKLSQGVSEVTAGTFHFFGLIIYRFVRLTAPYMFVLGCVEVIMKYFHHHSVFDTPTLDHETCPKYWWRNILYINTLFPVEDMVSGKLKIFILIKSKFTYFFFSLPFFTSVHVVELVFGR